MRRLRDRKREMYYHCMTRVVNGERILDPVALEVMRKMLWKVADFCGVEVLTYCLMSNHFHVLVRVPAADGCSVDDVELLRRYRRLYRNSDRYCPMHADVLEARLKEGKCLEAKALKDKLIARMHDLSMFMKLLKQRFSIWLNRTRGRYGTLWAERFKSVLVEGKGHPLLRMAQYIDLNPVRAGIVKDPADYRFCGYAEAAAGRKNAQDGIRKVTEVVGVRGAALNPLAWYLELLKEVLGQAGKEDGKGLKEMTKERMLLQQARFLSDGLVLGSRAFVIELMEQFPGGFSRLRKKTGGVQVASAFPHDGLQDELFAGRKCLLRRRQG